MRPRVTIAKWGDELELVRIMTFAELDRLYPGRGHTLTSINVLMIPTFVLFRNSRPVFHFKVGTGRYGMPIQVSSPSEGRIELADTNYPQDRAAMFSALTEVFRLKAGENANPVRSSTYTYPLLPLLMPQDEIDILVEEEEKIRRILKIGEFSPRDDDKVTASTALRRIQYQNACAHLLQLYMPKCFLRHMRPREGQAYKLLQHNYIQVADDILGGHRGLFIALSLSFLPLPVWTVSVSSGERMPVPMGQVQIKLDGKTRIVLSEADNPGQALLDAVLIAPEPDGEGPSMDRLIDTVPTPDIIELDALEGYWLLGENPLLWNTVEFNDWLESL